MQDRGTICQPGLVPLFWFLPGAQVQDFMGRLQGLVSSLGCHLVLLIPAGIGDTARVTIPISRTPKFWWQERKAQEQQANAAGQ